MSHALSEILPDCLSIVFSYHIHTVSQNYSSYPKPHRLFFRKFILCWEFEPGVHIRDFLERSRGKKLKLQYVSAGWNSSMDNDTFKLFRGIRALSVATWGLTCKFTDEALENLRGIESLDLSNCTSITSKAFVNLRGIKRLWIRRMAHLDDSVLEQLRGIEHLYMDHCLGFTDAGMANLRGIKSLDISHCTQLTDACFENFRGIQSLEMSSCCVTTSEAFTNLRGVKVLGMGSCNQTPGDVLRNLIGVQEVDISFCPQFSDIDLQNLVGVKKLNLWRCTQITGEGLHFVRGVREISLVGTNIDTHNLAALREVSKISSCLPGTEEILCNLRRAKSVELYDSFISEDRLFANLANVEMLGLYHANLNGLTDEAFRHLHKLKEISIWGSSGGRFTKCMLQYISSSLQRFEYDGNTCQIQLYENDLEDVMEWFSNLKVFRFNVTYPSAEWKTLAAEFGDKKP